MFAGKLITTLMAEIKKTKARLQQLRDYAKLLYTKEKITQKEISGRVGISEATISKWARLDSWETLKLNISVTREERMMSTITQLTELDKAIANKPEGFRYPDSKEADTRRKLVSDLSALEVECGVRDIVNVSVKFLEWMRKINLAKAQELSDYFDGFIKDQLR
jgi:transcriptional regulator with XRE-family HTH domain